MEVEDKFAVLIGELSKGFSWRLITQFVIIALLGIPIAKLYVYVVPKIFPWIRKPPEIRYVLVPANEPWINSGVVIKPGQKIIMHASGRVNLAVHRLVDSAKVDIPPTYNWNGPEGIEIDR
ncbi:MAG: hypothetical protein GY858_01110, partial [Candidatus Omnitrophica bacterium]|nr:hypothetical protein [Candidatus Omnitrophota bacterium]